MKQRGVHDVFHASLLRVHLPNDDRRFPGRLENQLGISTSDATNEWAVDKIVGHHGRRAEAIFEILWKSGDRTWMPYDQAAHLSALADYLEALGIADVGQLPYGTAGLNKVTGDKASLAVACVALDLPVAWNPRTLKGLAMELGFSSTPPDSNLLRSTDRTMTAAAVVPPRFAAAADPCRIIPLAEIPVEYSDFNAAHRVIRRQSRDSFVVIDGASGAESIMSAMQVRLYVLQNIWNNNPDNDVCRNPAGYRTFAINMNTYDHHNSGWSYFEDGEEGGYFYWVDAEVPTLAEFMVRGVDVFPNVVPPGKVLVDKAWVEGVMEEGRRREVVRRERIAERVQKRQEKASGGALYVTPAMRLTLRSRQVEASRASTPAVTVNNDETNGEMQG
ncbi:hypothetical protein MIND_00805300 [Mycena indigotica]|uniref:Uncharacterized protein n=1 Tax=Mycena indigotica TaxID=2126181 RepID=A0A8H6SIQ8_9AGAR|nr:uncharacterized protein MIND_00805300 [Mycena indigotica]KAF7298585.1 hypothetical protein MIND_00805300 [Mycena indigotica]